MCVLECDECRKERNAKTETGFDKSLLMLINFGDIPFFFRHLKNVSNESSGIQSYLEAALTIH